MRELLAYSQGAVVEEKITLRIRADNSGDIYLPTAWYSSEWMQGCEYDWMVSLDGGAETEYSGAGSDNSKIRVGYWLSPLSVHTVTVKPKTEEYGWLRAFWYKGTDIASSLINIISDKSYKGYAVSDVFTWDYYKAYQYYGCVNLVNTDEELLPDTLLVIGNKYRYYEYAGCVELKGNAEEKILKTVRVIWDDYRAYQYQNCSNITNINMRAINWASVWNNYRYNQFSGMGNDRKPMKVYIEGWIEEWGDWWLTNDNVAGVYVYVGLVSDYQTKLSTITSSKIQKNAAWDGNEYEFIEFIATADSTGKIRIPIGWFSTTMSQDCAYDWMISIDGDNETEYTGTGDDSYFSIGSWLTEGSEHRIVIKPKTVAYGWGRAFGYYSTGAEPYIKELIHDSYKCFASNRLETWDHYKHATFVGCTNLINSYEKLPTSVTTIGDYYMKECYAWCTGLKTAFWEVMHSGATIGVDYRHHEYTGCTDLEVHQGIAGYTGSTYPTNYKYEYLSWAWNDMDVYITRYEPLASGLTNSMWIANNKVSKVYCFINSVYNFTKSSYWSNINDDKFKPRYYNYVVLSHPDINKYVQSGVVSWLTTSLPSPYGYDYVQWIFAVANNWYIWVGVWSGDKSNYSYYNLYFYQLWKRWDITTAPATPFQTMRLGGSAWGGEFRQFYSKGKYLYVYWLYHLEWYVLWLEWDWSKYVQKNQVHLAWGNYSYGENWFGISNNGQFLTCCWEDDDWPSKNMRTIWEMTTPRDITTLSKVGDYQDLLIGVDNCWSDDGYVMYTADYSNSICKQYNLSIPFQLTSTVTDTWKTLSWPQMVQFSNDYKRLYWKKNTQYDAQ